MNTSLSSRMLRNGIFAALFFCTVSVQGQISVPDFTPTPEKKTTVAKPSLETHAAKHLTPVSLIRKDVSLAQIKEIRLAELTAAERDTPNNKKQFRVGVVRPMPSLAQKLADYERLTTSDGTLYLLRITSPQASALRLHLAALDLPDGATVFVYSRLKPDVFAGPYNRQTLKAVHDIWTPSLPGEEVIVELFIPTSVKLDSIPFRIDSVSHIYRSPRALISRTSSNQPQSEDASACNLEVPVEWQSKSNAVGLIAFVKTDGEYACSGTLLTDVKKTRTPFFLTANHCVATEQEATSAEIYWFFDRGAEPLYAPTRGAKVLVTDKGDDYSLLEVAKPPDGVTYSGWTTVPPDFGTTVTSIHHPQADHKRISFGQIADAGCPAEVAPEFCNFYSKVRWGSGITEPGSSGGGLFVGPANDSRLIGILSGGESACDNQSGIDLFARFTRMYGAIGYYLTNGDLCRYTLLQDQFSYGASGGNGSFTIVPKIGGENCPWQARSNADWITITSGATGTAMGAITFQVAANPSDKPRAGAITIAGRNVLILQTPAIAPTSPCAANQITFGQTVTGDLQTAGCSSMLDGGMPALRYSFQAEAGQSIAIIFQRFPARSTQFSLMHPDGYVRLFRDSYSAYLPKDGTYVIELALFPTETSIPLPFEFQLVKRCKYKFSTDYVELDGFGLSRTQPDSFAKIGVEATGENCFNPFAVADEPDIDNGKLRAAVFSPTEKVMIIAGDASTDPKLRYIVIRVMDQPFIIKQIPLCSSATTFSYTPSQLTLPGLGGTFQMQVKRTAGPSCSWEVKPYFVYDGGQHETRDVLMQPENYSNWSRGTDDGTVTYKMYPNNSFRSWDYALQKGTEVVQTIKQTMLGETCARTTLQTGQTVNGSLTTSDCAGFEAGQYVDVYQLNLTDGEQLAIELTGTAGAEIAADWGFVGFGSRNEVGDLRQKANLRWPETGFYSVYGAGTYLLRVIGKPGTYQLKILGVGPSGCVYKINQQGDISVPASATSFPVQLECNRADCDWTGQSSANWITIPNGGSGRGSQIINLTLTPNTGAKRQATVTIAGRTFNLIQDFACTYRQYFAVVPNKLFASHQGGEYNYYVETGATCPAPAITSEANWVTTASLSGAAFRLNIAANSGSARNTTIKVGGETFEVWQGGNDLTVTTAGNYQRVVAPDSLVTLFNPWLTNVTATAQTIPLPLGLGNVSLYIERGDGTSQIVPLLYTSPTQINFHLPENIPAGRTKIRLYSALASYGNFGYSDYATGEFEVANIAPNVFTADASGKGPAAANIQRIRPGQPDLYEPVATTVVDEQGKPMIVARPFSIGADNEKTYLVLYATGLRKRNANAVVTAQIGDVTVPVEFAGPQGQFVGLDQINILLPSSLRGKGLVNVTVTIDGKITNPVQINIAP